MITSIPAKKIRNEVSTIIGYGFGPNTTVQIDIDGTVKYHDVHRQHRHRLGDARAGGGASSMP